MGYKNLFLGLLALGASTTLAFAETATTPSFAAPAAALTEATEAATAAWEAAPLGFSKALFVTAPAGGYGQYEPRDGSKFAADETLHVYAEPVAYAISEQDGTFSYALSANFRLLNPTGQVLAESADFASFSKKTRSASRELSTSLSFQFSGLPSGTYALEVEFNDRIGGKSGTINLPFSVVEAPAQ